MRRDQRGFSIPELLVAMLIGLLVLGAAGKILVATSRSQPKVATRSTAILNARFVVDRITRELRQGSSVPTATASQLSILTYVKSATCGGALATTAIACRVTYTCTGGICTRTEALTSGGSPGPAVRVVTGLSSSNVFSYLPSSSAPTWVGVTMAFPGANGTNALTIDDGAELRNATQAAG